jgi:outer membrane protein assembly factor BamB
MTRSPLLCRVTATFAAALLIFPIAVAADWTRWLGPDQNGASPEKRIFGQATPELDVVWSRPLGIAYSGIAVAANKALTLFGDGETDWLTAIDASSGEEVWRYRIDSMFPKVGGAHGGPLSTPVIEDGVVYALGAKGQLFAVKLGDGSELWSVRIDKTLGAKQPQFGFTTTPLIVDDLLFVQTGGPDGHSMTALERETGKLRWSTGDEVVGYQSPILVELAGREQIVAVTNKSVMGLAPEDGTVLWRKSHALVERDGWSTPLRIGPNVFLLVERYESLAFQVRKTGDAFAVSELWRGKTLKNNFAAPVIHDGHIYGYSGDFLACVDPQTGELVWKARSSAAGLILVDGHLVIFAADGAVVVAEASPEGYKEKVRVKVSETAGYTFPSFSNGGIYVRNLDDIARVDVVPTQR